MIARRVVLATAVGALVALTGCAGIERAPSSDVVGRAVATPCPTDLPPRPAMAVDSLALDADIWTIGTALWSERLARDAYELALVTRLKGCIAPAAP